jgi:sigma-B regulation protein RsbU (phosphoserine phosphatase)
MRYETSPTLAQTLENNSMNLADQTLLNELKKAIDNQSNLLNGESPKLEGGKITGTCLPAKLMGGDYYDIYPLVDGRIRIVIGDVMGKGISAAMLMLLTRGAFRSAAECTKNPGETLSIINQAIYRDLRKMKSFVTLFCADWDPKAGTCIYANAGHNLPLFISGKDGTVQPFPKVAGIMIGGLPNQIYTEESIRLENCDKVFFYTDGIIEAQNKKGDLFQMERLIGTLVEYQDNGNVDLHQYVIESVNRFTEGVPQRDDITMVLLKVCHESANLK